MLTCRAEYPPLLLRPKLLGHVKGCHHIPVDQIIAPELKAALLSSPRSRPYLGCQIQVLWLCSISGEQNPVLKSTEGAGLSGERL